MRKCIVLSSGGVDSTTCLGLAVHLFGKENVHSVSFYYGQKHNKELECAEKLAQYYGVNHTVLDLSQIFLNSNCSLLHHSTEEIRHESYVEQIKKDGAGMVRTYVPFRNGLMLSAAASLAGSLFPDYDVDLYIGAHADDAAGSAYADCSLDFVIKLDSAISVGTYKKIRLVAPFVSMSKAKVVNQGLSLNVPYELTWSCYEGGAVACGTCGTCIDRAAAFRANNVTDPAREE